MGYKDFCHLIPNGAKLNGKEFADLILNNYDCLKAKFVAEELIQVNNL